jgi:hypothetical protein
MNISYTALIYKSIEYLKFFYEQFNKFTKLGENDEFYFIANDATEEILNYLENNSIKYYIHQNTLDQKKEWYINNVYRAWNTSIKKAKNEYIIFLNSDFAFSENWSENLKKYISDNNCVCSRLIERGREDGGYLSGKYGIEKSFGKNPHNYREKDFNIFCNNISAPKLNEGGLFMPLLIKKKYLEIVNYYPEGNVKENSDIFNPEYLTSDEVYKEGKKCISGDVILMKKLESIGIKHYTAFDSLVYHFQEGEMKSNELETEFHFYGSSNLEENIKKIYIYNSIDNRLKVDFLNINRNDGWSYNMEINTYNDNINCTEFYLYRINENLSENIYENTIISKANPDLFLEFNKNYYLIDKIYLKIYIPHQDNLLNTIKYYYNNGIISIIETL